MSEYRAYVLDDNGYIIGRHDFVCDGDQEAVESAKRVIDGHDIEIWERDRLVSRLLHKSPPGTNNRHS